MLDNQGSVITCYAYQQLTAPIYSKFHDESFSVRAQRTPVFIDYIYAYHDCYNI